MPAPMPRSHTHPCPLSHPGAPGIAPGTGSLRVELFDMRLEDVLRGDGSAATATIKLRYQSLPSRAFPRGAPDPTRSHVNMSGSRWKAVLPSCPAAFLCARATRVVGLRRPRITFGACGCDGARIAGTARASTRTCEHWHRHLPTCEARWPFSSHVLPCGQRP